MSILPIANEQSCFGIRLESIGGLGANLAGKMLAESGVLGLGLNGSHFSTYGSEKKGSPVKSFIRFSEPEVDIRDHSPIELPDVIGIFSENAVGAGNAISGLLPGGIVLVNAKGEFEDVKRRLGLRDGTLAIVDALGIAVEERTRINTAMLGALFRICSFLDPDSMRAVIRRTFEKKSPHLVEANLRTFNRGYDEVAFRSYTNEDFSSPIEVFQRPDPAYGYRTQPIGGVILTQGNSLTRDLSGSRQGFLPVLDSETCIHCANCDSVCPDFCFVWEPQEDKKGRTQMMLKGIDYQYCKGCMKCTAVCPTGALSKQREETGFAERHRARHQFQ